MLRGSALGREGAASIGWSVAPDEAARARSRARSPRCPAPPARAGRRRRRRGRGAARAALVTSAAGAAPRASRRGASRALARARATLHVGRSAASPTRSSWFPTGCSTSSRSRSSWPSWAWATRPADTGWTRAPPFATPLPPPRSRVSRRPSPGSDAGSPLKVVSDLRPRVRRGLLRGTHPRAPARYRARERGYRGRLRGHGDRGRRRRSCRARRLARRRSGRRFPARATSTSPLTGWWTRATRASSPLSP